VDKQPSAGSFGNFAENRKRNQRLVRTVKFVHPPSAQRYVEMAATSGAWAYKNYTVTYELPTNFIPVDSPAMIATTGIAATENAVIMSELFGYQDKFNIDHGTTDTEEHVLLDDGDRCFGDVFALSCSSIELAKWICEQIPIVGTQYELVYDLNGRSLIPRGQFESMRAREDDTKQENRDRLSAEHTQLAKEQNSKIDRLREDQAVQARAHTKERQDDKKTMALILFANKDDNKVTRKMGRAENAILRCDFNIQNWENALRVANDKLDDFCDDDTAAGQRKAARARAEIEHYHSIISKERGKMDKETNCLEAYTDYESPWQKALVHRLGDEFNELANGAALDSAPSFARITEAEEGRTKKARMNPPESEGVQPIDQPIEGGEQEPIDVDAGDQQHAGGSTEPMDLDVRSPLLTVVLKIDLSIVLLEADSEAVIRDPPILLPSFTHEQVLKWTIMICMLWSASQRRCIIPLLMMLVIILTPCGVKAMPISTPAKRAAVSLSNSHTQLKLLALNCNGFGVNAAKLADVYALIMRLKPHIVVLSETRQKEGEPVTVPTNGLHRPTDDIRRKYQVHHESKSAGNASTGVTMLIRNGVNIAHRVPIPREQYVMGRIAAVDLAFPDLTGKLRKIRIIGIYAPTQPTSPGDISNLTTFWSAVTRMTQVSHDWVVGGDCNAFIHRWEAEGGTDQTAYQGTIDKLRKAYLRFIADAHGIDVWDDRMRTQVKADWTCTSHHHTGARKILDRYVHSTRLSCRMVHTHDGITGTNHRPVEVQIITGALINPSNTTRASPQKRLLMPRKGQAKDQYANMNDSLSTFIKGNPPPVPSLLPSDSTRDFDALIEYCDSAFESACSKSFKRGKPTIANPAQQSVPLGKDKGLVDRKDTLGRLIRAFAEDRQDTFLKENAKARKEIERVYPGTREHQVRKDAVIARLRKEKSTVITALRKIRLDGIARIAEANKATQIKTILRGGSIKYLFDPHHNIDPPFVQRQTKSSTRTDVPVASDPAGRLDNWHNYFADLHSPVDIPAAPKPWMDSPASRAAKKLTAGDLNFVWPQTLTMADLKGHMSRGNQRPSPGPDGWEKWALRRCSDDFLSLILDIINYMITTNYIPARMKENFILPLYKRGDVTDPRNHRGIIPANCMYNIMSSWFTFQFQRWIWKRGLLPASQIATQQGVQVGDLTMYLQEVHRAAEITGTTIYCMRGDHTKGFDNLASIAYLDMLEFNGINPAVAAFEKARTKDLTLRVKTADGICPQVITTNGQTKQGDSPSPIKYTGTMGMRARWFTHWSVLPPDDSILFATSWDGLKRLVALSETFQAAYGIQTAWDSPDKTVCFTLGAAPPETANGIPISEVEFVLNPITYKVPITDKPSILRTQLNNQQATRDAILSVVDTFPIPADTRWPLGVLRRSVKGMLMSRIRPRLALQPLPPLMAAAVDSAIATKVCTALGIRNTNNALLTLPASNHGFGFPSVETINGQIAINMVLRALNHHLSPFRTMARITMANWMCLNNGCVPPMEVTLVSESERSVPGYGEIGPQGRGRPRREPDVPIPMTWKAAHQYMKMANVPVIETDQSYLSRSAVCHLIKRRMTQNCDESTTKAASKLLLLTPGKDHMSLKDWIPTLSTLTQPAGRQWVPKAIKSVSSARFIQDMRLLDVTVFDSRAKRKRTYNNLLLSSFRTTSPPTSGIWATDGSSIEQFDLCRSTTAAITGPSSAMLQTSGQYSSSLHGERLGLIAALLQSALEPGQSTIITDHLISVLDAERIRHPQYIDDSWKARPGHELYSWLSHPTIRCSY